MSPRPGQGVRAPGPTRRGPAWDGSTGPRAPGGPGRDRLTRRPSPQVLGKRLRAGVTPFRFLAQAFQANRFEIARQGRTQLARRLGLLGPDALERVRNRLALVRR